MANMKDRLDQMQFEFEQDTHGIDVEEAAENILSQLDDLRLITDSEPGVFHSLTTEEIMSIENIGEQIEDWQESLSNY